MGPRLHRRKVGWGWGTIFRMILGSAYVSLTLKAFPEEAEPEPAIILRTLKGRTNGAVGALKFCSVIFSSLCASGEEGS